MSYIFKQLTWLVEVIRHNRRITLKALSEKWSRTESTANGAEGTSITSLMKKNSPRIPSRTGCTPR